MKCEFCGEEITPGALACPRCGGPISKPVAAQPTEGIPAQTAAAPAQPPVEPAAYQPPPDPPLAKVEEDFIALAEESVMLEAEDASAPPPPEAGPLAGAPDVASLADQSVPPGAHIAPDQYVPQETLTGGYKGPETSSVAGAGVQTADDPFGLNITETAPPSDEPVVWARSWRYSRWWNLTVMIIGIAILVAGIGAAVYFGFIRKGGPGAAPTEALRNYIEQVVSGDTGNLNKVAAPGSQLAQELNSMLKGYEKYGIITLKGFETKTVKVSDTSATVQITKLDIELQDEKGNKEMLSILNMTKPFELNKLHPTIEIIKQNGTWLVKT